MTKANIINDLYANYLDDRVNGIEALIKAITKESVMLLHDADHAQDFVIEVWLELPALEVTYSFAAWLYKCLRNKRAGLYRSSRSHRKIRLEQPPIIRDYEGVPLSDEDVLDYFYFKSIHEPKDSPDEEELLATIPDPVIRRIGELILDGKSQKDIAALLGIRPVTLRKRLQRYRGSITLSSLSQFTVSQRLLS